MLVVKHNVATVAGSMQCKLTKSSLFYPFFVAIPSTGRFFRYNRTNPASTSFLK